MAIKFLSTDDIARKMTKGVSLINSTNVNIVCLLELDNPKNIMMAAFNALSPGGAAEMVECNSIIIIADNNEDLEKICQITRAEIGNHYQKEVGASLSIYAGGQCWQRLDYGTRNPEDSMPAMKMPS